MTEGRAPDSSENGLEELISEVLEAVTFVRDYVQLQFGSPSTLNVYIPMTVRHEVRPSGAVTPTSRMG